MARTDRRLAFGTALDVALATREWSQQRLGESLTRPVSQSAVSQWLNGETEPRPHVVFEVERLLKLAPGDLSQLLGYLPLGDGDRPSPSVIAAVQEDQFLKPEYKRVLLNSYRELVAASTPR